MGPMPSTILQRVFCVALWGGLYVRITYGSLTPPQKRQTGGEGGTSMESRGPSNGTELSGVVEMYGVGDWGLGGGSGDSGYTVTESAKKINSLFASNESAKTNMA